MYEIIDVILRIAHRGEEYYIFNCDSYEEFVLNEDAMKVFKFMKEKPPFFLNDCLNYFDIESEQLNAFIDFLVGLNLFRKVES